MNPNELTERRRLRVDSSLPMKEEYEAWLRRILEESEPRAPGSR